MKIRRVQNGAVLIVALIMLVLITLTGVSTAALIRDNTQVIQNFESRATAKSAAMSALQQALARGTLVSTGTAFTSPCADARTTCIDANGDGASVVGQDILVTLSAVSCVMAIEKSKDDIDGFVSSEDSSCTQGVDFNNPTVTNLCAEAVWEVSATAEDPITGATSTVRQGLATSTTIVDLQNICGISGT